MEPYDRITRPHVYSFRTSPEILSLLKVIAFREHRYKCEIMEDAVKEYFENHYDEKYRFGIGLKLARKEVI